jgi:peptidoglycan/LPS O-acetylase OafA/YrhL
MNTPLHKTTTPRVIEIDALRGIAALAVLLFHYSAYYQVKMKSGDPFPAFNFNLGELGVDLFFMISGYVILLTAEASKSITDFSISRFVRLWPSFFVCCTITTIFLMIYPVGSIPGLITYLKNLTLQPNLIKGEAIDGVYWSLFIEVQFYIIFIAILFFRQIQRAIIIFSIFTILCVFYQGYLLMKATNNFLHYYLGLLRHAEVFLAGILCYRFCQTRKYIYIIGIALASIGILTSHWMRKYSFGVTSHYISYWFFAALLIYVTIKGNKLLRLPIFTFFGKISYPLYLLHMMIGFSLMYHLTKKGYNVEYTVWGVILLVIGLASVVTWTIDIPVRKPLKKLLIRFFTKSGVARL